MRPVQPLLEPNRPVISITIHGSARPSANQVGGIMSVLADKSGVIEGPPRLLLDAIRSKAVQELQSLAIKIFFKIIPFLS